MSLFKLLPIVLALLANLFGLFGCLSPPMALPGEFSPIVDQLVNKIAEDGLLDKWMTNARAHGVEPGIATEIYMKLGGAVFLKGIDADVRAEVSGTGSMFAPGTVQALTAELAALGGRTDPEANAAREQILALLTGQADPSLLDVLERLKALESGTPP